MCLSDLHKFLIALVNMLIVQRMFFHALFSAIIISSTTMAVSYEENLKIAAFNIQVFGRTKASNKDVMDTIVTVCSISTLLYSVNYIIMCINYKMHYNN